MLSFYKLSLVFLSIGLLHIPSSKIHSSTHKAPLLHILHSQETQSTKDKNKKTSMHKKIKITLCLIGLLTIALFTVYIKNKPQQNNLTNAPHLNPTTEREIIENIAHAVFLDPQKFPRKSKKEYCVDPLKESFFKCRKPWLVMLNGLKSFGKIKEQKKKLVDDAMQIAYQEYFFTKERLKEIWKQSVPIPKKNILDNNVLEEKKQREEFTLDRTHYTQDNKKFVACTPSFSNKDFGGGISHGGCALEEWRLYGAPAELVKLEYIKIKALQEAQKQGKNAEYARKKRLLKDRVYILKEVPMYQRLGHYGTAFRKANFKTIKGKIKPYNPPKQYNVVAAAAPDRSQGAGKNGEHYNLSQVENYFNQAFLASYAQTHYFIKRKKEAFLCQELGNFGSGAFTHDSRAPFTIQFFACYFASYFENNNKTQVFFSLYPFDKKGKKGLDEAKKIWRLTVERLQSENIKTVSPKKFCQTLLEVAREQNKPFRFTKSGDT